MDGAACLEAYPRKCPVKCRGKIVRPLLRLEMLLSGGGVEKGAARLARSGLALQPPGVLRSETSVSGIIHIAPGSNGTLSQRLGYCPDQVVSVYHHSSAPFGSVVDAC